MKQDNEIAVLGLWHLGLVTAVGLAEMGWQVVGFDEDEKKISKLNHGISTIFEPELQNHLRKNLSAKRLKFTKNINDLKGIKKLYFAFDTPLDDNDQADLSIIWQAARKLKTITPKNTLLLISSQVPIGSCEKIQKIIGNDIEVCYIPENLRLGKAWYRFFHPGMIVIGTDSDSAFKKASGIFEKIKSPIIQTTLRTSEMVKHAINSYLATSISYANELSSLSELSGADFFEVARILKMDERIGPFARVNPGLGFAGGTLARDLRILQSIGRKNKYQTIFIDAVLAVNEKQKKWVSQKLKSIFKTNINVKKIGILGLTYTAQTSTLRRSLSIETIDDLLKLGFNVQAYDPKADREELMKYPKIEIADKIENLAKDSDALVVMTEWPEFLQFDWRKAAKLMKTAMVIDPKNFLRSLNLEKYGFRYICGGKKG